MKNKLAVTFSVLGLLELKYNPLHVSMHSRFGHLFSETVFCVSFLTGMYLVVKTVDFIYGPK